jgi:PAS domain S-box-containing protein
MTIPKPHAISTDRRADSAFIDELPDPVVLFGPTADGSWRISHVNPACEAITGWTAAELVGREPTFMIGPLTDPGLPASAFAEMAVSGSVRRRVVLHRRDGSPVWCEIRAGILPDSDPLVAWAHVLIEETADGGRFRRLLENVSDTVAVLDADGTIRYISPSVEFLGVARADDYLDTNFFNLLEPEFAWANRTFWFDVLARPGVHGPIRLTLHGRAGLSALVEVVLNNRLDDPEVHGIVVTARSLADEVSISEVAAQMERRLRALVRHASDILLVLDDAGRVTYTSPSVERIFGLAPDPSGQNGRFFDLLHPDDLGPVLSEIAARLEIEGHAGVAEARLRSVDGSWTWFELAITNLLKDPDVEGYVVNGRDVTERKQTEALLAGELSVLETMASSHTLAPVLRRLAEVAESFMTEAACSIGVMDDDGVIRHPAAPTLPGSIV